MEEERGRNCVEKFKIGMELVNRNESALEGVSIAKEVKSLRPTIRLIFLLRYWNTLLGICVVTWACVVVLGGFLGDIGGQEFMRVSFLLVMHALYLTHNTSWPYIVVRLSDVALYFAGRRILPSRILPGKLWRRYFRRVSALIFFVLTFSTSLVSMVFSTVLSLMRIPKHSLASSQHSIHAALKIFYVLVLINAFVADVQMLALNAAFITFKTGGRSVCALSYFFRANTLSQGKDYFRSREVDLIDFVYDMMSDECGASIENLDNLQSLCVDMVPYVYHHPRGFEATFAAFESPNYYVQEAAAYMVGFLVHLETNMGSDLSKLLPSQQSLVQKLVDLGIGPRAVKGPRKDAALWSLKTFAHHNPEALALLFNCPKNLVEVGEQHDGLLPLVKILNATLQNKNPQAGSSSSNDQLKEKFERIKKVKTKVSAIILFLLQNTSTPAKPNSKSITINRGILLLLYISVLGSAAVLSSGCFLVYAAILTKT